MNIFKKVLGILSLTLTLFTISILLPQSIQAAQFHFKSYTLTQEETVNEDVYAIGDTVTIDGVVNGDLIVIADTIQVNGTISGDTYLLGTKIDVDANIYGNTFLLANNTTIAGLFTQNTYIASSFLTYDAETQKDVFALSMESNIKGSVGDDLRTMAMRTTVDSIVRGDLILLSNEYRTGEDKVTGNIYYNSTLQNIAKEQGVDLDRRVEIEIPSLKQDTNLKIVMSLIGYLAMCLVGFIIITLTPVKTIEIRKRITDSTDEFLKSLAVGIILAILIPLPLFILFISIIGAPAALFITGLLSFILIFGKIWVETAFGKEILELFGIKEYRPFKSFLVGRTLSLIINFIPVVRGFYNTILGLVALGAIVRMKKSYYLIAKEKAKKPTKKK